MSGRGTPGPAAAPSGFFVSRTPLLPFSEVTTWGDGLPARPDHPAATASHRWPAPLRLMAVHAHPDDESSKGAATMARYARGGVDVMVCTLTSGERGDILNKAMDRPEIRVNLSRVRQEEMARAREILGVRQQFLGFIDSGLPEGDPLPPLPEGCFALQKLEDAAGPLVRAVREFRPHVMMTYDETGGYPHPDHVMTHQVSVEAFDAAADPDRYPGSGEPWQPLKLYYFVSWFTALHEEMERRGPESPYTEWFRRWDDEDRAATRPRLKITTRVPCADFFAVRDQALLAHATQIDPGSSWFACPIEVQQATWPTEDYHLARSLVDTELPEDDLFAGVGEMLLVSAAGIAARQAR
jgi:mycothiol S-conjugate amidase